MQLNSIAIVASMVSGLETFVRDEIDWLSSDGFDVHLYVTKYKESKDFNPANRIPLNKPIDFLNIPGFIVTTTRNPLKTIKCILHSIGYKAIIECLLALSWAHKLLRNHVQLIYCTFGDKKFFVGYFLHLITGIPIVVKIHAHEIYAQPNKELFRKALESAVLVITISKNNRDILINHWGVNPGKLHVIRLPIDNTFWKPANHITVVTVARFTPRKGWRELMLAAEMLGEKFRFIAVGFGELNLEELAIELGVRKQFTIFPKLSSEQIREILWSADIFCLPSIATEEEGSEGIPVALMEAMAVGLPIVTTDDGSICELVDKVVVPAGDIVSLASALTKMAMEIDYSKKVRCDSNIERVNKLHKLENRKLVSDLFREVISI